MAKHANATLRSAWAQSLIDTLGASHKIKFYSGTQPADTGAAHTGTLLATLTADATPGSVSAGVLTFDAASYTQTNSSHTSGTPTYVSLTKSDDTRVYELAIPSDGMTFTGTVQNGVDIARGAWTWTAPDA
ncbi:MAG: hypothetical protein ABS84_14880 [Rubrivivax sp. SCN 71-131]|nr:MAG: hypothetical protein ABS84_14880 [Rubrivivax sp. SCN 71-131]